jgi:hypothetical protein
VTLTFSNPSRSFDEASDRIRFWGYDSAIEVAFYIEVEALRTLCPHVIQAEAGYLEAFDLKRKRIREVAGKLYAHGRKGSYVFTLEANHF